MPTDEEIDAALRDAQVKAVLSDLAHEMADAAANRHVALLIRKKHPQAHRVRGDRTDKHSTDGRWYFDLGEIFDSQGESLGRADEDLNLTDGTYGELVEAEPGWGMPEQYDFLVDDLLKTGRPASNSLYYAQRRHEDLKACSTVITAELDRAAEQHRAALARAGQDEGGRR